MNKKFLYSLLIILAFETLILIWFSWPFYAHAVSPFDSLLAIFIFIFNILLAIIFAIPKITRKIGLSFLCCSVITPFIFVLLLDIQSNSFNNHAFSDDVVYKFEYEGESYQLELHDKDFEKFLNKSLSAEEKKETDMNHVYEIVNVRYNNNGKKDRLSIVASGNYKQVGKNEYVLNQNGHSPISSRYVYCAGIEDFDAWDTLEFKIKNDSLCGLVKKPLRLHKIYNGKK